MTTITAVSRAFARARRGRLPRAATPPWADSPLSYASAPSDGTWVPNPAVSPDGVPDTIVSATGEQLVAGFWTTTSGTWADDPKEIHPGVATSHSDEIPATGAAAAYATAWYFDLGSPGGTGKGSGVSIDEIQEARGGLLLNDESFVSVAGDAELTRIANQDGWVPTDSAQVVTADAASEGMDFVSWMYAGTGITPDGTDLRLAEHANGWALAVYQDRSTRKLPPGYLLRPQIAFDEAALLLRLAAESATDAAQSPLSRIAAGELIATLSGLLGADHGAEVAKLAQADRHEAGAAL
jgi:hypothetical protein